MLIFYNPLTVEDSRAVLDIIKETDSFGPKNQIERILENFELEQQREPCSLFIAGDRSSVGKSSICLGECA